MSEMNHETQETTGYEAEEKTVPVSEAIRYRKRAQAAEKEVADLQSKFEQSDARRQKLEQSVKTLETQHQLTESLTGAGALDVEAAMALAEKKMQQDGEIEPAQAVEQLRKEKPLLFSGEPTRGTLPGRTQGLKEKTNANTTALSRRAQTAARSGSRKDVHEYMRARRANR